LTGSSSAASIVRVVGIVMGEYHQCATAVFMVAVNIEVFIEIIDTRFAGSV